MVKQTSMHMKTKLIEIVDDRRTDKHMIGADNLLDFLLNSGKKGKIEFCPYFLTILAITSELAKSMWIFHIFITNKNAWLYVLIWYIT